MDYLQIVIEELEREKQTLLSQKSKNIKKIKECEEKIEHYTYLYNCFKQYSMHYGILIDSLGRTKKFADKKSSLFEIPSFSGLFYDLSLDDLLNERNFDLRKKQIKCEKKKVNAEKCLDYYVRKLCQFMEENADIDVRIVEIEETISEKQAKKQGIALRKNYLIQGVKENDWY